MELNRPEPVHAWRCGDLVIDPHRRAVLRGDRPCPLGARAFDVLVALVERSDRVVGKHELLDLIWPDSVVEENNLQVHISALRKLMGAGAIATVPGRGYRFTAPLQPSNAAASFAWHQRAGAPVLALRPRFCAFVVASLDGFVAREDGGLDWLQEASTRMPPGEDCGYGAFLDGVDMLVMGRRTFERVRSVPPWPYPAKPVHVLSRSLDGVPTEPSAPVTISAEPPAGLASRLQQQGMGRVSVDGGKTLHSFLREGLLDELVLTTIPVLLGRGRPVFGPVDRDMAFSHAGTKTWPFGFVQTTWRRA